MGTAPLSTGVGLAGLAALGCADRVPSGGVTRGFEGFLWRTWCQGLVSSAGGLDGMASTSGRAALGVSVVCFGGSDEEFKQRSGLLLESVFSGFVLTSSVVSATALPFFARVRVRSFPWDSSFVRAGNGDPSSFFSMVMVRFATSFSNCSIRSCWKQRVSRRDAWRSEFVALYNVSSSCWHAPPERSSSSTRTVSFETRP